MWVFRKDGHRRRGALHRLQMGTGVRYNLFICGYWFRFGYILSYSAYQIETRMSNESEGEALCV